MPKQACFRHADVAAANRCYHCKKYICKSCRHHLSRHYFCGNLCHWRFRLASALAPLKMSKVDWLIIWNALLTAIVLLMFAFQPSSQPQAVVVAMADTTPARLSWVRASRGSSPRRSESFSCAQSSDPCRISSSAPES